jgi:biotin synthase
MTAVIDEVNYELDAIERLLEHRVLKSDILKLLTVKGEAQQELFYQARTIRARETSDKVHLRGVIEISNYCQKSCDYCAIRAPNKKMSRYRMNPEEILELAYQIRKVGITTVFLQAGQDPKCDALMEEVIPKLKSELKANVLLCFGERPKAVYERYRELGADSYILKYETSDAELYQKVVQTPLSKRLECARWIQQTGMLLGVGNIVGLPGQSFDSLAEDILLGFKMQPNFISVSPFIANQDTPFETVPAGDFNITLNTMAINRILHNNSLIPTVSAMEKLQPNGQLMGLNAGANVITINFTPPAERDKYNIYSKERFVVSWGHALKIIEKAGLKIQLNQLA